MNWKQVRISVTEQAADVVSSFLIDAGAQGVQIEGGVVPGLQPDEWVSDNMQPCDVSVIAYFGEEGFEGTYEYIRGRLETLRASGTDAGSLDIIVTTVPDTDWNENFRKHFTAFRAAGRVVVKPTWEKYKPENGDIVIEMDPGMAFGSGVHETTRMCLELLQKYMRPGAAVLDVGCGSGILGIAADKLGARSVLALDYDSVSVEVARDNAKRNGAHMEVRRSDLLQNEDNKAYDIVLANIIADIILRLNESIWDYLAQDGVYIISGIIEERLGEIIESLRSYGLKPVEMLVIGDWRAAAVRRDDAPGLRG
jgi:ribosomal protein L11 methyltransferase